MAHETREAWLLEATDELRPTFDEHGAPVPPVLVSTGFPKGSRGGRKWIEEVGPPICPCSGPGEAMTPK